MNDIVLYLSPIKLQYFLWGEEGEEGPPSTLFYIRARSEGGEILEYLWVFSNYLVKM